MTHLTQEQIREALRQVIDPELRRNIVDLDMVREIRIDGNQIHVTIALTVPNCPLQDQISNQIGEVLDALADDLEIEIEMTAMTEEEKRRLTQKLRGQQKQEVGTPSNPAAELNRVRSVIAVMSGKGGRWSATRRTTGRRPGCRHYRSQHPQALRSLRAPADESVGHPPPDHQNGNQAHVHQSVAGK